MAVYERGNGYEANVQLGGKRYRKIYETKTKAYEKEREWRELFKAGKPIVLEEANAGSSIAARIQTIDDLTEHCNKIRWASQESTTEVAKARQYVRWIGPKIEIAEALNLDNIHEYVEYLFDERGVMGSTVNRHLSAISVLSTTAESLEKIVKAPQLPWQKENKGRVRFYTIDEETQMLGRLVQLGHPEYVDLFIFLAETGCRLSEAERLRWQDIRGRYIAFEQTKNNTDRGVVATPRVTEALKRLKDRNPTSAGPFKWLKRYKLRTVWATLRGSLEFMGADTVVHTFRHTCASRLAMAGKDIYRIQRWMGHKSITTTQRYAHLMPQSMEELADALASYTDPKPL